MVLPIGRAVALPLNESFDATLPSRTSVTPLDPPPGEDGAATSFDDAVVNAFLPGTTEVATSVPAGSGFVTSTSTGYVGLVLTRTPGVYRITGDAAFLLSGDEVGVYSSGNNRLELIWSFDLEEEMEYTLDLGVGGMLFFTSSLASTTFSGEQAGLIADAEQQGGMPNDGNNSFSAGVLLPDRYTLQTTLTAVGATRGPFGDEGYGLRNGFGSTLTLAVPEPSSIVFLLGSCGVLLRRR